MLLGRTFLFKNDKFFSKMLGQKKISAFFTSTNQKRSRSEDDKPAPPESHVKKVRAEVHNENDLPSGGEGLRGDVTTPPSTPPPNNQASPALSPEQKAKMDEKKWEAKMKLTTKNTNGVVVNMGATWFKALEPEFTKSYFTNLCEFVDKERRSCTVYPPVDQVFTFTTVCDIKKIKVVILGQDPYHGPRQAHGLCFSVQKGVNPPPSLENMYKELKQSVEGFEHPGHGDLTGWAKQGVLLLNACLTVRAHNANSHANKGWEQFTDAVITWLNRNLNGVVFMLWGSYAQKKGAKIDKKRHHVLKAVHPSPLSAYRGFFGCKHFTEANRLLQQQGKKPIDWKDLPKC